MRLRKKERRLVMENLWKSTDGWKRVESLSIWSDFQPRQTENYSGTLLLVGPTPLWTQNVEVFNGFERKQYYPAYLTKTTGSGYLYGYNGQNNVLIKGYDKVTLKGEILTAKLLHNGRVEKVVVTTTFFPRFGHADYGSEVLLSKEEYLQRKEENE
jgi:hypothetical protein